jgi:hypothetical protein
MATRSRTPTTRVTGRTALHPGQNVDLVHYRAGIQWSGGIRAGWASGMSVAHITHVWTQAQLSRDVRRRSRAHLIDESCCTPEGVAIYALSDPRDVRNVRYVGQSTAPRRRLLQHLSGARLWVPDELPWWIAEPSFRPLHEWLRDLYRDEARLPMMIVSAWVAPDQALIAERARIRECLDCGLPLLNVQIFELQTASRVRRSSCLR